MLIHAQSVFSIWIGLIGFLLFPAVFRISIKVHAIPLFAFSLISLILFVFSLFGAGEIGIIVTQLVNTIMLISASLCLLLRKRPRVQSWLRDDLWSSWKMLAFFCVIFFFLGAISRLWFYTEWDEFAYLDAHIRSLLAYGERSTGTFHPTYPPGNSLPAYYFVSISRYNEHVILFAAALISVCGVFYSFAPFEHRVKPVFYPILGLFSLFILSVFSFKINMIYTDGFSAILFGAFLINAFFDHSKDHASMLIRGIMLSWFILLKDVCAIYTFAIIFIMIVCRICEHWHPVGEKISLQWIIVLVIPYLFMIIPPLLSYSAWKLRVKITGAVEIFDFSQINLQNILELYSADVSPRNAQIHSNIYHFIFQQNFERLGMPLYVFVPILFLMILIAWLLFRDRKIIISGSFLLAGFILFNWLQNLHYIFVIEDDLAWKLNSYTRYLSTYLIGWLMLTFTIYLHCWLSRLASPRRTAAGWGAAGLFIFIFICMPVQSYFSTPRPQNEFWRKGIRFEDEFGDLIPAGSTVQLIQSKRDLFEKFIIMNVFIDRLNMLELFMGNPTELFPDEQTLGNELSRNQTDFVVLGTVDEQFWAQFGNLFDIHPDRFESFYLYESNGDGTYSYVRRNEW